MWHCGCAARSLAGDPPRGRHLPRACPGVLVAGRAGRRCGVPHRQDDRHGVRRAHLATLCGRQTLTVVAQNGLDQVARVDPFLPATAGPACPARADVVAERAAPGSSAPRQRERLVVPRRTRRRWPRRWVRHMEVSGTEDIVTASWRKLLGNIVANPITAITRRHMDVMRAPGIAELARCIIGETVNVGRAEGARLVESDADLAFERLSGYGADTGTSMLHDRLAGRPTEYEYLTGEVVRVASATGSTFRPTGSSSPFSAHSKDLEPAQEMTRSGGTG